jgi:hypothetical protein
MLIVSASRYFGHDPDWLRHLRASPFKSLYLRGGRIGAAIRSHSLLLGLRTVSGAALRATSFPVTR